MSDRAAILVLDLRDLATMMKLPEGAHIMRAEIPFEQPSQLRLQVRGIGTTDDVLPLVPMVMRVHHHVPLPPIIEFVGPAPPA